MNITLRFFASVRETLGTSQETLALPAHLHTVGELRALLIARGGVWAEALAEGRSLRMACNQIMCNADTPLTDPCEVAFFPPVTGG
ncbi:molybdopterin converting factor subunit 1 [Janthinobacterium fluminis]|uniref:Molybdopterin converting factor subunit 1 n=1 Tax=Janthinobacterium fluminis TaxID=2987524 RepID=A0ABT5JW44_9BURK|nr:molybdopterin converting factor subunit 1 [Janthinobacterium fluminis]MDC8756711.1 molybdopterin converting factor subunit 1 [Janthinobacterium fluminis]